ncbi:hypothetical protein BH10BAC3_BH10BAC3_28950 [soil metagenome]
MDALTIRNKLYDYIRVAEDKKLFAIYDLLENEIEEKAAWWNDKEMTAELDERYSALETGKDHGFTLKELSNSISHLREKKYGK